MADEPKWLSVAREQVGVAETPGPRSTPKILAWAQQLGAKVLGIVYRDDAIPWCGTFAAMCISAAGLDPPKIAVRAKSWATWGEPLQEAIEGAILVFQRPGGGHVGFACGQTTTAFHVLGGNQSDKVCLTWIAKNRCVAIRWPRGAPKGAPIKVAAATAGHLSENEA